MSITSLPAGGPPPRVSQQVAAEVRALMGRHNVTQMQLSKVLGVSQTGISKRLRGKTPFDVDEIGVLARYFGVLPGDLFGDMSSRGDTEPASTLVRSYRTPHAVA